MIVWLVVAETVVLVVLCVLVAGLLRAYAQLLRRLHAVDGGGEDAAEQPSAAPAGAAPFAVAERVTAPQTYRAEGREEWSAGHDVAGTTLAGEVAVARVVGTEQDTLLAFLSSGCAGCVGFWDELRTPGRWALPAGSRLLVVAKDEHDESVSLLDELCPPGVDLVMSGQAWSDYDVPGSPYVVVVDGPTGRVKGEGSGASFSQLSALVAQAAGDSSARVRKPARDTEREIDVDRELMRIGIMPGDPRLYEGSPEGSWRSTAEEGGR